MALVRVSAAVGFPLLSFGIYKKDSQGPSHISLPSGWWLVLPSWVPPSEEGLVVATVVSSFLFSVTKYSFGSTQFLSSKTLPNTLPVHWAMEYSSLTDADDALLLGFGRSFQ